MMQEFVQAVNDAINKGIRNIHTAMPGTIREVDAKTGLVSVVPSMVYRKPDGSYIDYPMITGVPVVFPQSSGASVVFPVKPGDGCLVIIAEKSTEYWLTGQITDTELSFDLSNAICIPGLYNKAPTDLADAAQNNAVIVRSGESRLRVTGDGIEISGGNVVINGDLTVHGKIHNGG